MTLYAVLKYYYSETVHVIIL